MHTLIRELPRWGRGHKVRVAIAILLCLSGQFAFGHEPKDGDIWATLGGITTRTATPRHAAIQLDPGLTVEADVYEKGGLEISMFYLRNAFYLRQDNHVAAEFTKRIYISTGYRHWFSEKFSGAIALASSYTMGNYKVLEDDFPNANRPGTSARDSAEYGVDLSLQHEPWHSGRFALVVEGRLGVNVTPKRKEDASHVGVYIALKYFVQSRQVDVEEVE